MPTTEHNSVNKCLQLNTMMLSNTHNWTQKCKVMPTTEHNSVKQCPQLNIMLWSNTHNWTQKCKAMPTTEHKSVKQSLNSYWPCTLGMLMLTFIDPLQLADALQSCLYPLFGLDLTLPMHRQWFHLSILSCLLFCLYYRQQRSVLVIVLL